MATLLSFMRARPRGWSNEEKAQFARIQKLLGDAGVAAEIDFGMTDEGDPWCAVCSGITDEVIIHIARVDGLYLFDSAVLPTMIRGRSLDDCAQRFIDDATVLARRPQHGSTVFMHPSAMLAGVILTIFLYMESVGESSAHGRTLIELDADVPDGTDIIDVAEIEGAAPVAKADAVPGSVPANDGGDSSLLALKQMLQQIAEAVQKQEGDRNGTQGTSQGHSWGTTLLSSGAVVAAIAYAQDSIASLSSAGDSVVASSSISNAATDGGAALSDLEKEAGTGPQDTQDALTVDAAAPPVPAPTDVVEVLPEDFLFMAQALPVATGGRTDRTEPTILMEATAEDRFVFATDEPAAVPEEEQGMAPASLSQDVEEISAVSSLVLFMSSSSIEIKDEIVDLGDFIEVFGKEVPRTARNDDAQPTTTTPLPFAQEDAFLFPPAKPHMESVSIRDIADWITGFVKVTGVLRYEMADRSNLTIYDRSVLGRQDSDDLASRSFALQDDSVVTFVGFGDELDLVFAA